MTFKQELVERENKPDVIKLYGELDIYESTDFKNKVLRYLNENEGDLYFDFSELDYIDSTGLGALIAILKQVEEMDRKVYLNGVNERIRKLFKITKLEEMFVFLGDIDE